MPFTRKAIILLLVVLFKESDGYCPTVQEGETVTFKGTFTHTLEEPVEIIWSKEGIVPTYSKCNRVIGCRDSEDKTKTSLASKGNNVYEFSFQINNVTKNDFGLWKMNYGGILVLKHGEPLYTCKLEPTMQSTDPNEKDWFCIKASIIMATLEVTAVIIIMVLVGACIYYFKWRKGKEKAEDKLPLFFSNPLTLNDYKDPLHDFRNINSP